VRGEHSNIRRFLALIGLRFFPNEATLFALLFFAVSPGELELARRTWGDALTGLISLSLVYVAGEITPVPAFGFGLGLWLFTARFGSLHAAAGRRRWKMTAVSVLAAFLIVGMAISA
jgi:hypothetical protein